MATVQDHYARHLAPVYTWMAGGAAGPRRRFADFCATLGLKPSHPAASALDLGAGSGFQAIPLAEAGYVVTAVDLSAELLTELAREAGRLPIRTIAGDLRELERHCPTPAPEVIVCMGDTLTHLASLSDVTAVLRSAATALARGGHLLLSFRDYTVARTGTNRFIPVRNEEERIFTCFLEYGPTHVSVHDLVHTRTAGAWHLAVSSYEKLRLAPAWVIDQLAATGLSLVHHTSENGLVTLAAHRTPLS